MYALDGIAFSSRQQHLLLGLSPRFKDGGYCIFITLNKDDFDPAHNYEDQLFSDRFVWVTRRDRGEDHPDYVRLRQPDCRVSLFARAKVDEDFAYLGELEYAKHRQFHEPESERFKAALHLDS